MTLPELKGLYHAVHLDLEDDTAWLVLADALREYDGPGSMLPWTSSWTQLVADRIRATVEATRRRRPRDERAVNFQTRADELVVVGLVLSDLSFYTKLGTRGYKPDSHVAAIAVDRDQLLSACNRLLSERDQLRERLAQAIAERARVIAERDPP